MECGTSEYRVVHYWIEKQLGTPTMCSECKSTTKKRYDWANISGEYKKDLRDWIRLCRSCHCRMDKGQKCKAKGHKIEGDNAYVRPSGLVQCIKCKREARKEYYWKHKEKQA